MQTTSISTLYYSLDSKSHKPLPWTSTQQKSISHEYPFTLSGQDGAETPDDFVARTYLQFLWLPESIMPLDRVVPSLLRVTSPTPTAHPLNALLDVLLLTPRAISKKYNIELPQILSDGGGAGEMEESMMWYALNHEKVDVDEGEESWMNEQWRKRWLERLEKREVQLQILLHLLRHSLPEPPPTSPNPPPSNKRKRQAPEAVLTTTESLELLFDKLSMWQLLDDGDVASKKDTAKDRDGRDWTQAFCEDLVERQFINKLPEACLVLRKKVFPNSPFSEDDEEEKPSSPSPSPSPPPSVPGDESRTRKHLGSASAPTHPTTNPARARSRSLSVSLAHDAEARKAGINNNPKRVLNREVSMSRVFKAKSKECVQEKGTERVRADDEKKDRVKRKEQLDAGVTLVAATPVKVRSKSKSRALLQPTREEEGEDIWELPSSPNIVLLGCECLDEGGGEAITPTKRTRLVK